MKIKRLGVLANEVFKTVNNLNPNYMRDIFTPKLHPKVRPNYILFETPEYMLCKKNSYGAKRIRCKKNKTLGPKIWNQLPGDIKSETSYTKFKEYIDTWFGPKCRSNECMNI